MNDIKHSPTWSDLGLLAVGVFAICFLMGMIIGLMIGG